MQTKMSNVKITVEFVDGKIKIHFRQATEKGVKFDSKTAKTFGTAEYILSELPESIYKECPAARHGIKQKLIDNLAMPKGDKETTSVKDAISMTDDLWAQLKSGNWNAVTRGPRAASVKLSDMEVMLLEQVKSGAMTFETADTFYKKITGKDLPKIQEETSEETPEEENTGEEQ